MTTIFNQPLQKTVRRTLRQKSTEAEDILWRKIRANKLGCRFRRQFGIGKYIVDFYASRRKLVVELDGPIHEGTNVKENDNDRQKNLASLGLTVLRFTNNEITGNLDDVLLRIKSLIPQNPLLTKERAG